MDVGRLARPRRKFNILDPRSYKSVAKFVAPAPIDAHRAAIDQRAVKREGFGIEPAAGGDRLAVRSQHRGSLDILEPGHLLVAVSDAAGEPAALVGDGDEALALGVEPQARQSAQAAEAGGQDQAA